MGKFPFGLRHFRWELFFLQMPGEYWFRFGRERAGGLSAGSPEPRALAMPQVVEKEGGDPIRQQDRPQPGGKVPVMRSHCGFEQDPGLVCHQESERRWRCRQHFNG